MEESVETADELKGSPRRMKMRAKMRRKGRIFAVVGIALAGLALIKAGSRMHVANGGKSGGVEILAIGPKVRIRLGTPYDSEHDADRHLAAGASGDSGLAG